MNDGVKGDVGTAGGANLLVLSDLHIGQDMNGLSRFRALRQIGRLDRELRAFLDYYANHPIDGRPWRLVLAGDIIDFMQVNLRPSGEVAKGRWGSFSLTADEERYGVGYGSDRAVWKLEQVVRRHRRVFVALARFCAAGHEVVIVRGNHDDELHIDEVQAALRHMLAELLEQSRPSSPPVDFERAVRFFPWFYYQEGVAYIEHGHQYDEYSSFEYFLEPGAARHSSIRDLPLTALAARYFANLVPGFPTLEQDTWTFADYLRWGVRQGRGALRVFWMYVRLLFMVFVVHKRGRATAPVDEHWLSRRFDALERVYGLPRAVLQRLHALQRRPAGHNLWRSLQMLCVDRLLVLMAMVLGVVGALLLPLAATTIAIFSAAWVIVGAAALWWLSRIRDVTCDRQLAEAAKGLAQMLRVKFVVMGHSHTPVAAPAGGDHPSFYLNTGTWIPPRGRVLHDGPCTCKLTYLAVLAHESGARAQLRRWCGGKRRPEHMEEVG